MEKSLKITKSTLKEWEACIDVFKFFDKLFPDGADLKTAANGLDEAGHEDWAIWLFNQCRNDKRYKDQALEGFKNTGDSNAGDSNAGHWNAGHRNAGHWNAGHRNAGHSNAGHSNAGDSNAGHSNAGHRNAGHWNAGHRNAGDSNAGHWNAGHSNAGHWNAGHRNAGHSNAGHWNAGHRNAGHSNAGHSNAGDSNAGHSNAGHRNAGDSNAGHWNAGHRNAGHFNTTTQQYILLFNKLCKYEIWEQCNKPDFIYKVSTTYWVFDSQMTDEEKKANPKFWVACGELRVRTYKEAWKKAWNETTENDRKLIEQLPNFDAEVFFEISGIDLRNKKNVDE